MCFFIKGPGGRMFAFWNQIRLFCWREKKENQAENYSLRDIVSVIYLFPLLFTLYPERYLKSLEHLA